MNVSQVRRSSVGGGTPPALAPDKLRVEPALCLLSELVMDAGEDDEEAISGVRGLGDQRAVVGGLPALDVAHDQSAAIEWAVPLRVLQRSENAVGCVIDRLHDRRRPPSRDEEVSESGPAHPVLPVDVAEPLVVVLRVLQHAEVCNPDRGVSLCLALKSGAHRSPHVRRNQRLAVDSSLRIEVRDSHRRAGESERVLEVHPTRLPLERRRGRPSTASLRASRSRRRRSGSDSSASYSTS